MEKNLYDVANDKKYVVKSIPNIKTLSSIGIFEGVYIQKNSTYRLGGPVTVSLGSRNIAIGKKIAKMILVEEVV